VKIVEKKDILLKECISDKIKKDQMICYECNEMGHYAKDCQVEIKIIKGKFYKLTEEFYNYG